jgi:hypothetical protein
MAGWLESVGGILGGAWNATGGAAVNYLSGGDQNQVGQSAPVQVDQGQSSWNIAASAPINPAIDRPFNDQANDVFSSANSVNQEHVETPQFPVADSINSWLSDVGKATQGVSQPGGEYGVDSGPIKEAVKPAETSQFSVADTINSWGSSVIKAVQGDSPESGKSAWNIAAKAPTNPANQAAPTQVNKVDSKVAAPTQVITEKTGKTGWEPNYAGWWQDPRTGTMWVNEAQAKSAGYGKPVDTKDTVVMVGSQGSYTKGGEWITSLDQLNRPGADNAGYVKLATTNFLMNKPSSDAVVARDWLGSYAASVGKSGTSLSSGAKDISNYPNQKSSWDWESVPVSSSFYERKALTSGVGGLVGINNLADFATVSEGTTTSRKSVVDTAMAKSGIGTPEIKVGNISIGGKLGSGETMAGFTMDNIGIKPLYRPPGMGPLVLRRSKQAFPFIRQRHVSKPSLKVSHSEPKINPRIFNIEAVNNAIMPKSLGSGLFKFNFGSPDKLVKSIGVRAHVQKAVKIKDDALGLMQIKGISNNIDISNFGIKFAKNKGIPDVTNNIDVLVKNMVNPVKIKKIRMN